jgi:hypothetical protein
LFFEMQSVQPDDVMLEANFPWLHKEQVDEPVELAKDPVLHCVQVLAALAPLAEEYFPESQNSQLIDDLEPSNVLNDPGEQGVQAVLATALLYVPVGQKPQTDAPAIPELVPKGHDSHTVPPDADLKLPAGHSWQGESLFTPATDVIGATRTFHRMLKWPLKDVLDERTSLKYLAVMLEN